MIQTVIAHLRQPDYVGENRCTPCTLVNIAIALVLSRFIAVRSRLAGVSSFVMFTVAIYFRGYLVPGTPDLTKQYFPERILQLFGKRSLSESFDHMEIDAKDFLQEAAIVEPCEKSNDLCLTDEFRFSLSQNIKSKENVKPDESSLKEVLGVNSDQISISSIEDDEDEAYAVMIDEEFVITWESRAAYLVDLSAAQELRTRYSEWQNLSPMARNVVLKGVRVFADICPLCGGKIRPEEEIVESCCSSMDVMALNCHSCGVSLVEIPVQK